MFLVSSCSCLCPIHWSQVLSGEWRCSWSSADRRWTTSELSTSLLPAKVWHILEVWRYVSWCLSSVGCEIHDLWSNITIVMQGGMGRRSQHDRCRWPGAKLVPVHQQPSHWLHNFWRCRRRCGHQSFQCLPEVINFHRLQLINILLHHAWMPRPVYAWWNWLF